MKKNLIFFYPHNYLYVNLVVTTYTCSLMAEGWGGAFFNIIASFLVPITNVPGSGVLYHSPSKEQDLLCR